MRLPLGLVLLFSLFPLAGASFAQDFNINFGPPSAPSSSYGAASGNAGYWNSLVFPSGITPLYDLAGQLTSASASPSTAMWCDMYTCAACAGQVCPGLSGSSDDQALLGSWIN